MRARLSEATRRKVGARQRWRCARCDALLSAHFQVDHVRALSAGGADDACNMQALCVECHAEKSVHDVRVAAALRGGSAVVDCPACGRSVSVHFPHACNTHSQQ